MTRTSWNSEREAALQAVRVGAEVMNDWIGRFTVQSKGKNDLVTEADVQVQTAIQESLRRRFPSDDFLGEEQTVDRNTLKASRRWIVDPIDGTTNFVHGYPFFGISLALEVDGELVVGVIHEPSRKETFVAVRGEGATCNGARMQVSSSPGLNVGMICFGLPAVPDNHPEAVSAMVRLSSSARSVRRMGSAAVSMAYVAAGRSDAFITHVIQPWDVAAGVLLVREAGGRVTNLQHNQYDLYTPNIVATNGLIHEELSREVSAS